MSKMLMRPKVATILLWDKWARNLSVPKDLGENSVTPIDARSIHRLRKYWFIFLLLFFQ